MKQDEVFRFVNVRPVQAVSTHALKTKYLAYSHDSGTGGKAGGQATPLQKKVLALTGDQARAQAHKLAGETLRSASNIDEVNRLIEAVKDATSQTRVRDAKAIISRALGISPDALIQDASKIKLRDTLWDQFYAHTLAPDVLPHNREAIVDGLRSLHFLETLATQKDDEKPISWTDLQDVRPTIPAGLIPRARLSETEIIDRNGMGMTDAPVSGQPVDSKKIHEELQRVRQQVAEIDDAIADLKHKDRLFQMESTRKVSDLSTVLASDKQDLQVLPSVHITSPVIQATTIALDPFIVQTATSPQSLQLLQSLQSSQLSQAPPQGPQQPQSSLSQSTQISQPSQTLAPGSSASIPTSPPLTHIPPGGIQRPPINVNLPPGIGTPKTGDTPKPDESDHVITAPLTHVASIQTVIVPPETPWMFAEFGEKHLNKTTLNVLKQQATTVAELSTPEVIAHLENQRIGAINGLVKTLPTTIRDLITNSPFFDNLIDIGRGIDFKIPLPDIVYKPRKPETPLERGIRPLGIGDLLTVRQELLRYEPGEIAHIENVMQSEHKTRTHTRTRETEEISVIELERQEESEKDLQTTERFELQKETQKAISEEMKFSAGLKVSAGWGPVSIGAHADFALTQSMQESQKAASTFAKQVTERAVSRIMERARDERTRRTLERFEERNEHGFDNRNSTEHAVGIFRWVDKYYKARIINYGKRLMMEFVIPEPAAFYHHLESKKTVPNVNVTRPEPPTIWGRPLQPSDLNKSNYMSYVSKYNVQDAQPYPETTVKVAAAMAEATGADKNVDVAKVVEKLKVPDGYYVQDVYGWYQVQGLGSSYFCRITIGGEPFSSARCHGLEGVVPIGVNGFFTAFQVNMVARCALKESARAAWQLKTYQAIMNAYERSLADYNEKVAAASIQAGIAIDGRNPEINRKIEMEELKKASLRMLTNDYAKTLVDGSWRLSEQFGAFYNGAYGYPEFDIQESLVEGSMIRFFEQAFDWQNMTYRFYPYFWGRKSGWQENFPRTDADPEFTDFLRAGAARVIVPAHPAYTDAILHYLNTNEIWNGGPAPVLDDPLFISIVEELRADTDKDLDDELEACNPESGYPCVVDAWEIKVPTSLVIVQEDSEL